MADHIPKGHLNKMKKILLSICVSLISTHTLCGVMYTYKATNGDTILTSKKSSNPTMILMDAKLTSTPYIFSPKSPQTQFEANYKEWVKAGKPKPALLIPERTSKEIGFTGYILFSIYSGKGLISTIPYNTDYTYDTYNDCMSEKNLHLSDFKKSSKNNLNPNYVYPKDIRKEYQYKCISEVVSIQKPLINSTTLKKWENEAKQEQQKEKLQQDKDNKDLEIAREEIESNKDKIRMVIDNTRNSDKSDISPQLIENPEPPQNTRRIIQLDDGTFTDMQ